MPTSELDQVRLALATTYRFERELGTGGHATVYLAHDVKHDRPVALKLLHPSLYRSMGPDRFHREIAVTARLAHPHILPLLDSGTAEGVPYYAMPFVAGESLQDRIRREGRLPIRDSVDIGVQVADALAYAHAQGILHRDIKPANIMLFGHHALVTDFGIAKAIGGALSSETDQTQVGFVIGTPDYMSPEQIGGDEHLDERSDEFSLALTVYECLVGDVPQTEGPARITLVKRMTESLPSARGRRTEIPLALDRTLTQALATEPARRFATLREFGATLATSIDAGATAQTAAVADAPEPVSLAVLPFQNLAADPDADHLVEGIADEIITMLSRLQTVRVCSRVSSFGLGPNVDDLRGAAQRLNVNRLLLGTVRKARDRLRISAQLVTPSTGFVLWSERFDRKADDLFAIEEEIGARIAESLQATLVGGQASAITTAPAADTVAYDQYLQGRHQWNRRTETGLWRSIEHFERATAIDPSFARGHAALGDAWTSLALIGAAPPDEAMRRARELADRALELDPSLAEARTTRGVIRATSEWAWDRAERDFRDAITLNRNYPAAHQWLATTCLAVQGRFDEASAEIELALASDPLSAVMYTAQSSVFLYAGRFPEAIASASRALEVSAGFALGHYFLALAQTENGDPLAGVLHGELAVERSKGNTEAIAALGQAAARAGDPTRARALLAELVDRSSRSYVPPTHLALVAAALGDAEHAVEQLELAAEARAPDLIWAAVRPGYRSLRSNARFRRIIERLGLS